MEAKLAKSGSLDKKKNNNGYVPKATAEDKTLAGRAGMLLGRTAASQISGMGKQKRSRDKVNGSTNHRRERNSGREMASGGEVMKSPEDIVFEGRRASVKDGKPKDLKFKKTGGGKLKAHVKKGGKPNRGAVRAAKWRAQGGAK